MFLAAEPDDLRLPLGHQKSPPSIVRVSCAIWSSVDPRSSIALLGQIPAHMPQPWHAWMRISTLPALPMYGASYGQVLTHVRHAEHFSCATSATTPPYSITPFITNLPAMSPAASPSASAMSFDLGNIAEPQTNTPGLGVLTGHLWMLPLLTPPSGDMGILRAVAIPMLSLFAGIAANARVPIGIVR